MKSLRKAIKKRFKRLLLPLNRGLEKKEATLRAAAASQINARFLAKREQNIPIQVLFACHMPSLWGMFESVYNAMVDDPDFEVTVVALPYKHSTLKKGEFVDNEIHEWLTNKGINAITAINKVTGKWLSPETLKPDYVFYQTPYDLYPPEWSVKAVSLFSKICYMPYGTGLFRGEVDVVVHPASFYKYTNFFFLENEASKSHVENKFLEEEWFDPETFIVSGSSKVDCLLGERTVSGSAWKRGLKSDVKRLLWTPRWRTEEGVCHFFDYKDYFPSLCNKRQDIDFVLRPHPLCFQNFLKTGELSIYDIEKMETAYKQSYNMSLDKSGEYADTFLTSDILISDTSSMLIEYLVTGKPIIYTHRKNLFNLLGTKVSEGFYWVANRKELESVIDMLLRGNDPLKEKRKQIVDEQLFLPEKGAGFYMKEILKKDFNSM